jgi:hypothetical protein
MVLALCLAGCLSENVFPVYDAGPRMTVERSTWDVTVDTVCAGVMEGTVTLLAGTAIEHITGDWACGMNAGPVSGQLDASTGSASLILEIGPGVVTTMTGTASGRTIAGTWNGLPFQAVQH